MTELSRRRLLTGAAAAAAATAMGPPFASAPARAAAPAPAARRRLLPHQGRRFRGDADRRRRAHLSHARRLRAQRSQGAGARRGRGRLHAERHGDRAVQSGGDQHRLQAGADRYRLRPGRRAFGRPHSGNMAAAGIDPRAIDIVVLSHLHPDHINGIRNADGRSPSPMPRSRRRRWTGPSGCPTTTWPRRRQRHDEGLLRQHAQGLRRPRRQGDEVQLGPGGGARHHRASTPAATRPGIPPSWSPPARALLVQSDVTNIPEFFLRNPEWHVAFDIDPVKAVRRAASSTTWRRPRRR